MDLSVAIVRIKHELKEKLKEVRDLAPVPPYVLSSILSEIQLELAEEEKELLTVLLWQAEDKANAKESEEDAEDNILHDNRESGEE